MRAPQSDCNSHLKNAKILRILVKTENEFEEWARATLNKESAEKMFVCLEQAKYSQNDDSQIQDNVRTRPRQLEVRTLLGIEAPV